MSSLEVIKYFRNALTAQSNPVVNFKLKKYDIITAHEVGVGKIKSHVYANIKISEKNNRSNEKIKSTQIESIPVIIVYKTLASQFLNGAYIENNIEELTGVYFIPCKLNAIGDLKFDIDKTPWIPREFLSPMCDPVISVGTQEDFDVAISDLVGVKHKIQFWKEYINYCDKIFDLTLKNKNDELFQFDKNIYIFEDESVNSIYHVKNLYNDLVKTNDYNLLLEKFLSPEVQITKPLINNTVNIMNRHKGQMAAEHPLNTSQRECINHYSNIREGDVLAISGPPGTGKTTLLQSVVANLIVQNAIDRKDAPVIVGASTNNQAVTNIINSFSSIKLVSESNFEKRWIAGINGFALYLPSASGIKPALKNGIQADNMKGEHFFNDLDSIESRNVSTKFYINQFNEFTGENLSDVKSCQNRLHEMLLELTKLQEMYLKLYQSSEENNILLASIDDQLEQYKYSLEDHKNQFDFLKKRVSDWRDFYSKLPFYLKWFDWIPVFKRRKQYRLNEFIEIGEVFSGEYLNIHNIEKEYSEKISMTREAIYGIESKIKKLGFYVDQKNEIIVSSEKHLGIYKDILKENTRLNFSAKNLIEANEMLDISIRYLQFWLSVHYFESRWLLSDLLSEKQKQTNILEVQIKRIRHYAQLTPCFVSTFFMLPKHFSGYSINESKLVYLKNYIDLLIVDEAGQVTPEVAMCSFSLAQKAVVVGDEHQIPPVYGIAKALDVALSADRFPEPALLKGVHPFLNCSTSSVMKIASMQCYYEKHDKKGLFLSEHWRCYNEIVNYCNKLTYENLLEPKRGFWVSSKPKLSCVTSPIMHYQVDKEYSNKVGLSRYNQIEANEIAYWIKSNVNEILMHYNTKPKESVIGIITPFKSQVSTIKKSICIIAPELESIIEVGTVHTFQGAEKQIIIFSTVYGSQDNGCYFIDASKNLLNVAVSRAKDAFIIFGDQSCLGSNSNTPSGLLKSMCNL